MSADKKQRSKSSNKSELSASDISSNPKGSAKSRVVLDGMFDNGKRPDGQAFADIFSSSLNIIDDGINSDNKGSITLSNDSNNSLVISPSEITADNDFNISNKVGKMFLTAPDDGAVVINHLGLGDSKTNQFVNNISRDIQEGDEQSIPTTSAVFDYVKDSVPVGLPELLSALSGVKYLVTDIPSIKNGLGGELQVFTSIKEAMKQKVEGLIYVVSSGAYWQEYIEIKKGLGSEDTTEWSNVKIYFSPNTTLAQPDTVEYSRCALVEIESGEDESLSVEIVGNINGGNQLDRDGSNSWPQSNSEADFEKYQALVKQGGRIRGMSVKKSSIDYTGNIRYCFCKVGDDYSTESGGGIKIKDSIDSIINAEIQCCGITTNNNSFENYSVHGGGISAEGSRFKLIGNISLCWADGRQDAYGGGVFLDQSDAMINGDVHYCSVRAENESHGGAIYALGSNLTLEGNIFSCFSLAEEIKGNYAKKDSKGGGLFVKDVIGKGTAGNDFFICVVGNVEYCYCFSDVGVNSCGGGVFFEAYHSNTTLNISGDILDSKAVDENSKVAGYGGGAYLEGDKVSCRFNGSIADCEAGFGGGLYMKAGAKVSIFGDVKNCIAGENAHAMHIGDEFSGESKLNMYGNVIFEKEKEYHKVSLIFIYYAKVVFNGGVFHKEFVVFCVNKGSFLAFSGFFDTAAKISFSASGNSRCYLTGCILEGQNIDEFTADKDSKIYINGKEVIPKPSADGNKSVSKDKNTDGNESVSKDKNTDGNESVSKDKNTDGKKSVSKDKNTDGNESVSKENNT